MQDNEIRFQMALLDGYPASCKINIESLPVYGVDGDVYDASSLIPDYLKDLNAVAVVVQKLQPFYDLQNAQKELRMVVLGRDNPKYMGELSWIGEAKICNATARQRCEAILRACGKWED